MRPVLHAQVLVKSNLLPGPLASRILRLCHKHSIDIDEAMARVGWKLQTTRLHNLSQLLQTHDRLIAAEKDLPPEHPDIAALCLQLGDLYESYERYADAEMLYKRALGIIEKLDGAEVELPVVLDKLAWVHVKQMKFEPAESIYRRVLELRMQLYGDSHVDVATSYVHLGRMNLQKGDHTEAVTYFQKALPILEQEHGSTHEHVANVLEEMAVAYYESADYDRAEPLLWQVFKIKKQYEDVRSLQMVGLLSKLADLYNKQQKFAMADSVLAMFQDDKSVYI